MSEPMTIESCRASQRECSSAMRAEIAGVREMVQEMDRERSGNRARFDQLVVDVGQIRIDLAALRKEAHAVFAIKMVEKIVFGLVGLLCVAVITALVKLVIVP